MRANRRLRPWNVGILALAVVATAGLGCGKNRVLMDVDVRSFMNPTDVTSSYATPPLVPFTVQLGNIPVNLVDGFADFGNAESAALDIALRYDNQTGQGAGHFTIFFGDDTATLYSTPPVAILDTNLLPATMTPGSVQIQADQRVRDLFTSKQFWMGVEMTWNPQGIDPLQGTMEISQLHVRLVSTMGLFD